MTAPGDSSGEDKDRAPQSSADQTQAAEQPISDAPWASPAGSPVVDYPPPADYPPTQAAPLPDYPPMAGYPPPNPAADYPPSPAAGYPPNPAAGYPPPSPPFGYTPPGYQPYGAAPQGFGDPASYPPPPPPPGPYGSYPGGYYPGPDYGGGYAGGYGAMQQTGTNTMAIISLVSGIVGIFCCVGSVVGIACGMVGINQIKQTREDGFGLAVAGIVISAATLLVYFVAVMFSLGSH